MKIKRALVSVSDKSDIERFALGLQRLGVEIISTGGTAKALGSAGVKVTPVSDVTNFPEMLGGRVKTLHPKIHGGILADRRQEEHMKQLEKQEIEPIDMVVVNLYPFRQTIQKPGVTLDEAIEQIDIGGPAMIRSAAKNFESVAVVVDPSRYEEILQELERTGGEMSRETRMDLAKEAFRHTSTYDTHIYSFLEAEKEFPPMLKVVYEKIEDLRYGENPHQRAAFYMEKDAPEHSLARAQQLHGKELSYNNILDLDAAWATAKEYETPACVIIKHNNPCGVAVAEDIGGAYGKALESDPVSAFGGVVAVNRAVDEAAAKHMSELFLEAIIAPAFEQDALEILMQKKNLRLLYMGEEPESPDAHKDIRRVDGGVLVQDRDAITEARSDMQVVTETQPTEQQWEDLLFAWRVAMHVKSNAIVLAKGLATVGVGAGQMSRIDSVYIAARKAGEQRTKGSVLASDAFFPFSDVPEEAARLGVTAIIQPGGAMRDEESIEVCNKNGLAMVFTGRRHFRH
ncbi:MAG: bifunctional phosphoribosylaminoimidazolecarboxamide formyltransferase/IMP cyclohydrolase PurH [Actinobacteria bacterium]|nr:MAG: bifunctional phosphoribosylaminoimidazolecarboxamide formyltransferase/IMP cyclohydrolase PurH [Actinomycetota bacterium]